MKTGIEEKILQELIDKVIEKDRDIKNRHEEEALKYATFESLNEMTELSSNEIKAMEKEIRRSVFKKKKRQKKIRILIGIIAVTFLTLLYVFVIRGNYKNEIVFTEDFDNNLNGWKTYNDFIFNKYVEDGKYIFSTDENEQSFSHKLNLILPLRFTAEITSTLIKGNQETYGVKINMAYQKSFEFALHPDNKTYVYSRYKSDNNPWVKFPVITEQGKSTITQKIVSAPLPKEKIFNPFKGIYVYLYKEGTYKYYVNDKFIEEQKYKDPVRGMISLFVSGSQSVSYDRLKITDNSTGRIIFDGPFGDLKDLLQTQMDYNVMSSVENGTYLFKANKEDTCFRSSIPYKLKKKTKVKLNSRWLGGETQYYGLILEKDKDNFYAFELKSDGKACFEKQINGKNEMFFDNIETGIENIQETDVTQTLFLNGKHIELYVNDKLIFKERHTLKRLNNVGFRVCGSQQVAFNKLEIWD